MVVEEVGVATEGVAVVRGGREGLAREATLARLLLVRELLSRLARHRPVRRLRLLRHLARLRSAGRRVALRAQAARRRRRQQRDCAARRQDGARVRGEAPRGAEAERRRGGGRGGGALDREAEAVTVAVAAVEMVGGAWR